ncbi:hypothetical protein [Nitrosomonas sp. Nm34]|uniref:DUF6998 domain-containing protein n=1 Tax=Nitrosomonas sp. Nm34 TaxID=1881055 RepID=UPI0008E0256E|nr:hypothetical protein [Nitrosomonas sp. Nm34]SFI85881.1 hypothetical protein SAMN05428978_10483 [Nitrosomonas sp. Nm34]
MALTQMQLIQSLGEAMAWFERELLWGVEPTELRHLCGRIGELYAALISNGQMAQQVNQPGYDVVSGNGERISVKTTAMMSVAGHVAFNANSLEFVDRVIVLRMNTEEMQIEVLLDAPVADVMPMLSPAAAGRCTLSLSKLLTCTRPNRRAATTSEVRYRSYLVRELESGTIEVEHEGMVVQPVKPVLRELAVQLNVGLLNSRGNEFNTRQLGTQIIQSIRALENEISPGIRALTAEA